MPPEPKRERGPTHGPPVRHVSRVRAILERTGNNVVLTDWDTAAYLHGVHGLSIVDAERVGPSTHVITLYDPDALADEYVIEFLSSESSLFADASRRMKKIVHSFGGSGKRRKKR